MAKVKQRKNVKTTAKALPSPFNIYWDKINYILFGIGLFLIILGFYFMSLGDWNSTSSLVISPIILFIGFVIVIPASILYRKKDASKTDKSESEN